MRGVHRNLRALLLESERDYTECVLRVGEREIVRRELYNEDADVL